MYHRKEGVYPKTWAEFESRMGPSDKFCHSFDPKERLVFVTADVFVPAYPTKERIILISREPFRPPTEGYIPLIGVWYKTLSWWRHAGCGVRWVDSSFGVVGEEWVVRSEAMELCSLGLSASGRSSGESDLMEFRPAFAKGVIYRVSRNGEGNPGLVAEE